MRRIVLNLLLKAPFMTEIAEVQTNRYYMPAEWSPHERCWMAWPNRPEVWGNRLKETKQNYAVVAQAIRQFEPVAMVVNPGEEKEAAEFLGPDIDIVSLPIDDSWTRDCAPCFLKNSSGKLAGVDLTFNAWGGKYAPYDKDADLARAILEHVSVERITTDLTAEGGGISVDGEGTILTTESCLLNTNRNPGWTKGEVEAELKRLLGGEKVIWLPGNRAETETDGHVDGIAAFVRPGVVLFETIPDPYDPSFSIVEANLDALRGQTDAKGRPIDIVFIEEAYEATSQSDKFCRSYINFYLANGGVIMPEYGIPADQQARQVLAKLFPDRRVVGVNIDDIAVGGGGIHCITQQQPKTGR